MRDCRRGIISLVQMKSPASSASAAEDMTDLMICAMVRMGPLQDGTGSSSEHMMCAAARLLELLTLRKAASAWAPRIILLARKVMPSLG